MICSKCGYKEHACSTCELTDEQEFYLRSLRICSECYAKSGLHAKWESHQYDQDDEYKTLLKECQDHLKET